MHVNHEEIQHSPYAISRAEVADAALITDVFIRSRVGMEYIDPNLHSEQETHDWLAGLITDEANTVLKAESGGKLAGFCVLREGWLDHLYVDPDQQGKGIGSSLLHDAQSAHPELQLWVFQQNTDGTKFYEANGFKLVEKTDGAGNEERLPDARYIWKREG
jgi:putative acetyltransferase